MGNRCTLHFLYINCVVVYQCNWGFRINLSPVTVRSKESETHAILLPCPLFLLWSNKRCFLLSFNVVWRRLTRISVLNAGTRQEKKHCNAIQPLAEVYERQCLPGPVGGGNGTYEPYKLLRQPCWSDVWLMSTGGWIPSELFVISYHQCHRNHHKHHHHHESAWLSE